MGARAFGETKILELTKMTWVSATRYQRIVFNDDNWKQIEKFGMVGNLIEKISLEMYDLAIK